MVVKKHHLGGESLVLVVVPEPFGKGGCRFVQTQRVELNALRQTLLNAVGEVGEHILARGAVVDHDHIAEMCRENASQVLFRVNILKYERVVEFRHNLLVDDSFQYSEIHHHATFGIGTA